MFKFIKAFTLAEVLVTLVIIGVIAGLTIPALIQNVQDTQYKTAYKKAFTIASQVTINAVQNQLFTSRNNVFDQAPTLYNFTVFKNQFSVAKLCFSTNNSQCWDSSGEKACDGACGIGVPTNSELAFIDNSGMAWSQYSIFEDIILVDTNGFKGPNRYGKDRWIFKFADQYNNRITVGLPFKIMTYYSSDTFVSDSMACHYPPCYFKSWLRQ